MALPARDHREVALEPLTLAEGRELALRLIGQDDPAAVALAETIVRESGGSPYFVYELVEYLKEGGELGEGGTLSTHFSLDSVLGRRIGRLPAEAVSLLEVLAVAGQPLRQAIACKAADLGALGFPGWRCCGPSIWSGVRVWDRSTRWKPTTTGSARRWSTIWAPSAGVN